MRFIVFCTLALLTSPLKGQVPDNYTSVLDKFAEQYNTEEYGSLYEMFAIDMKKALSMADAKTFFQNIRSGYGNINKFEYQLFEAPFQQYKAVCESGDLAFNISVDDENKINGLYIVPFESTNDVPVINRTITEMRLPFDGSWYVFWGGDTKDQNYHVESRAQKNAFDFIITDSLKQSHIKEGSVNEDYFAWGQNILSPCDAEVMMVVDGIWDNLPGEMNPSFAPGNCILLKTDNKEYILLAHLMKGSLLPKEGDMLKAGDLIGKCGNSGNSSEPHLHFHAQNTTNLQKGVGIKTYFRNIFNGKEILSDYSPVKGDTVTQG